MEWLSGNRARNGGGSLWTVLAGLPKEYDIVVTTLESSTEGLSLDAVLPQLLQVEQGNAWLRKQWRSLVHKVTADFSAVGSATTMESQSKLSDGQRHKENSCFLSLCGCLIMMLNMNMFSSF